MTMGETATRATAGNDDGAATPPANAAFRGLIRDAQISCSCTAIAFELVLMREEGAPGAEELEQLRNTAASSIEALEAMQRAIAEHLSRDA